MHRETVGEVLNSFKRSTRARRGLLGVVGIDRPLPNRSGLGLDQFVLIHTLAVLEVESVFFEG